MKTLLSVLFLISASLFSTSASAYPDGSCCHGAGGCPNAGSCTVEQCCQDAGGALGCGNYDSGRGCKHPGALKDRNVGRVSPASNINQKGAVKANVINKVNVTKPNDSTK